MELIRVPAKKVALAFGLTWKVLDPFTSRHSQIKEWREEGFMQHARYRVDGDDVYGLATEGLTAQERAYVNGATVVSGAACAAKLPQLKGKTALVVLELPAPEGETATVALIGLDERGIVVLDMLCDAGPQAAQARQSFAERVKVEYEVHGTGGAAGRADFPLQLEDLVAKKGSGPRLEPLRSGRGLIVLGAAAAVGLAVWGAVILYNSLDAKDRQRAQLAMLERQKPDYLYRQSIERLLQTPVVPLGAAIQLMRDSLGSFPLVHRGWELDRISCPPSGECAVRFVRIVGSGASIEEFRRDAPANWQGIAPVGQNGIGFTVRIQMPTEKLRRDLWPTSTAFRDRNFAAWQFLAPGGWNAELSAMATQALPPGLQAGDMVSLQALPEAVFAMPLAINAQPWWYANEDPDSPLRDELLGPHTVMVGDIELVHADKSITFSAKGFAYVQR